MGKKTRRKDIRYRGPANDSPQRSSSAAGSRSWSDMPSSSGRSRPEQFPVSWERRQPLRRPPARPHQGRPQTLQALFGTWVLPPPQRPQKKLPGAVSTCVARHQRREVLFATNNTGKGSFAIRKKFTNRGCK